MNIACWQKKKHIYILFRFLVVIIRKSSSSESYKFPFHYRLSKEKEKTSSLKYWKIDLTFMCKETKRILLVTLKLKYPGSPMQVTCHLITTFFFFPIFLHPIEFGRALAIETGKYMTRDSSGPGLVKPDPSNYRPETDLTWDGFYIGYDSTHWWGHSGS